MRSTIELGHAMGLRIVAEGIEDPETLEMLADFGCDIAQGYCISRPKPAERPRLPVVIAPDLAAHSDVGGGDGNGGAPAASARVPGEPGLATQAPHRHVGHPQVLHDLELGVEGDGIDISRWRTPPDSHRISPEPRVARLSTAPPASRREAGLELHRHIGGRST